jgi:hypothetical protein
MPTITEKSYESINELALENAVVQLVGAVAGLAQVVDRLVETRADDLGKQEHEQLLHMLVKVKLDLDRVLDRFRDE